MSGRLSVHNTGSAQPQWDTDACSTDTDHRLNDVIGVNVISDSHDKDFRNAKDVHHDANVHIMMHFVSADQPGLENSALQADVPTRKAAVADALVGMSVLGAHSARDCMAH